jgi:CDP-6-deoxy-D-xylo-4-hexulose-3-dehydrase
MRNINRNLILNKIKSSIKWNNQFSFIEHDKNINPSWMGLAILINEKFRNKKNIFINFLDQKGVETRPIISGSFVNQPAAKLYKLNKKNEKFPVAQKVQDLGFLIGLHTNLISKRNLKLIHDSFYEIDKL